jgi:hypothetical protein
MVAANNNKRSRDPSVRPTAIRITRRTSGVIGPPNSGTATPDPKRKRSSGKLVESDSSEEELEVEEEGMEVVEGSNGTLQEEEDDEESTETDGEGQEGTDTLGSGESFLPSSGVFDSAVPLQN